MCGFKIPNLGGMAVVVALVAGQGCAAAMYQDARLVGKGQVEFMPAVTRVGLSEGGQSEAIGTAFGGIVTAGVSDRVDFGAGYMRFKPREFDDGSNFVGFGPKISLVKDRAAIVLPVSFAFGNDADVGESLQFSPAAVFSFPLGDRVTFNPGARFVWSNCEGCDALVGAQAGFSVRLGEGRAILRPEVGVLKNPGESGVIWTFGVGLSLGPR